MSFKVGVIGATGAVGRTLLDILEKRRFPVSELRPFASSRSEGKEISLFGKLWRCQALKDDAFRGLDFVFVDVDDPIAKEWVPKAADAGAWVIDNSASFRLDPEVLLLVPEVNGDVLRRKLQKAGPLGIKDRILANPNCSTAQLVMALKPLQDRWGLKRVVASTYQSTSGAGAVGMSELKEQTQAYLQESPLKIETFSHQIAFNCIPHIGGFSEDGYTSEERKMMIESRKILGLSDLKMSVTAVRVPTFFCHAESVNIELEKNFEMDEVRKALSDFSGLTLMDDPDQKIYPMGFSVAHQDSVYVGRVRRDPSLESGLNLWVVSDNLRKGAALNAVQIGEEILANQKKN
jgi:aspartate-semialdehyde dehydrogenase